MACPNSPSEHELGGPDWELAAGAEGLRDTSVSLEPSLLAGRMSGA